MATTNLIDPSDYAIFQAVFGMIFTVLIALEFKHSLLVVLHNPASIVQLRSVILIALLALGLVYWLVRDQERRAEEQDEPGSKEIR